MQSRSAKIGMVLFVVYLVFYGGFVLVNAFWPQTMEVTLLDGTPLAGVNLAIWYGFALIVVALVLALMYGFLCRDTGDRSGQAEGGK